MISQIIFLVSLCITVAAFVMIVVMLKNDPGFQKDKLINLGGILAGSITTSTAYYMSYFDILLGGDGYYAIGNRLMDIAVPFMMTFFWFRLVNDLLECADDGRIRRAYRPVMVYIIAVFALTACVYMFMIDEDYKIVDQDMFIFVNAVQALLMGTVIVLNISYVLLFYTRLKKRSRIENLIIAESILIVLMAMYDGIVSLMIFNGRYEYSSWQGVGDLNGEFLFLSDLLILAVVFRYYQLGKAGRNEGSEAERLAFDRYDLSEREREIAMLIYERKSYEEIAEKLFISRYTVKRHVHNIYEKMNVSKRADFVKKISNNI